MILDDQRELFEIPEGITYLNCAYMAPQLRTVREAGERAVARKSRPWKITPPDFFEESERSRSLLAEVAGGDTDGVSIIPSASYGLAVAAKNVTVERGESILVLEEQFPSNVYAWRSLAGRRDARLVTVPRPPDHDWTSAVLDRVDGETAVVAVPHCHWTDGSRLDLVEIGARAREAGAALVVDATQSLGAYPLDVEEVRPDFLVAAAYKWLLGPYSLGFLYAGLGRREGEPLEHNWITRRDAEDFGGLTRYRDDYAPGARRYDVGERSNFVLLPMANEALRQLLEWGVGNISGKLGELTGLVEREAARAGIPAVPADQRGAHMIGLRLGPEAPEDLALRLASENVFVSVRGESVRVSPHLYNTREDVERLFEALAGMPG
ncbi:MAG: aminotransferase class V-fold PLP-dependent enzyme [Rubrobacter sp.]|nr:aminotransferase class V-fold PLP-dependent enzyme [Rubrobacter sp.]